MADESLEQLVVELTEQVRDRHFGKYRGTVKDTNDPDQMGRIVANVPSVYGDLDSPWALPAVPLAGNKYGFLMLPKSGDGVWIEFEGGLAAKPIWTGMWWARGELPDPGAPQTLVLVTPGGLKIVLDDDSGQMQLIHPKGPKISMTENDITLNVGQSKIVISQSGVDINDGTLKVSVTG